MSTLGILMMGLSYSVVFSLTIYCFYRVLTTPDASEHEHSPLEIDTRDADPPAK
ncbi:hypothetical protein Pan216_17930 [Planctomycetes bacterium Pan216]|uniref:Cbb3-type cytochrome oxidase component FixQ n=1 Tax=Kolteria novifilia TaxID=2527975 RepID=A0A518B1T2_9BACT|nr:hypothetical protein Pan216_17930 [Planctomycetes bacterium Pan216]